jgi:GxxExxY protein
MNKILKEQKNPHINYEDYECGNTIKQLIEYATNIYNNLGSGYSESIYHKALEVELRLNDVNYESEKIILINYKGYNVGNGRADIIINNIVVELKAMTQKPTEKETIQVMTYLNSLNLKYGLIINFPQPGYKETREKIDTIFIERESS